MSNLRREPLEELAQGLVDGRSIDWDKARSEHDGDLERLRGLQLLDDVGRAFHEAGAAASPEDPGEPILFLWGPLDVIEKLDEGSYGQVYRAIDRQLRRPVALKLRKGPTDNDDSEWMGEAQRLARLRHPNVLTVHGAAIHEGRMGLWTELLSGDNLRQQLTDQGPLSLQELVTVGSAVCAALAAIHKAGMVHGDVKASNVVQEQDGNVVLLDFGSGSDLDQPSLSAESQGSPLTSAPEVLDGGKVRPAADIYSLGAMLYLLASGRPPIDTDHYDELHRRAKAGIVPPLSEARPDLPPAFTQVIHKALEVAPRHRFKTGKAFQAALDESLLASAKKVQPSVATKPRARPQPTTLFLLFVTLAVMVAAWWALSSSKNSAGLNVQADLTLARSPDVPLADGNLVSPGDRLELQIQIGQPTHLYLFNEDENGESFVLFPLPGVQPQNPLPAGSHRLPGTIDGESQSWVVTSTGGSEHFLVVASANALPSVQVFLENTRKAGDSSATSSEPGDNGTETVRGVGGLTRTGAPPAQNLESLRAAIRENEQEVWLEWIRLDNPLTPPRQ